MEGLLGCIQGVLTVALMIRATIVASFVEARKLGNMTVSAPNQRQNRNQQKSTSMLKLFGAYCTAPGLVLVLVSGARLITQVQLHLGAVL